MRSPRTPKLHLPSRVAQIYRFTSQPRVRDVRQRRTFIFAFLRRGAVGLELRPRSSPISRLGFMAARSLRWWPRREPLSSDEPVSNGVALW